MSDNPHEKRNLSEQQLLRIERNKQLAKERLSEKLKRSALSNPATCNPGRNGFPAEKKLRFSDSGKQIQSNYKSAFNYPDFQKFHSQSVPKPELGAISVKTNRKFKLQDQKHPPLEKNSHSDPLFPHSKQKIKANFVIVSREMFQVNVPYDADVIALFKQMNNKLYGKIDFLCSLLCYIGLASSACPSKCQHYVSLFSIIRHKNLHLEFQCWRL